MTLIDIERKLEKEIDKEMELTGFICNSDNTDRIIDEMVCKYVGLLDDIEDEKDNLTDELIEKMQQYCDSKYYSIGEVAKNGDVVLFYTNKKYKNLQEFAEENGIVGICGVE